MGTPETGLLRSDIRRVKTKEAVTRVLSQKEMRRRTEKRYQQTSEVKQKKSAVKIRQQQFTNRLMADIFKKKLQTKALKGQTNLSNSINIISAV